MPLSPSSPWRNRTQWAGALVVVLCAAPFLYLYATAPITTDDGLSPGARAAIGDYETAKAAGDDSRTCFYAGVVVATMISARDTAGVRTWGDRERDDCQPR